MDAPVPASALIHSATLVSAGIYILFRFYDIIHFAGFSTSIALLGACTAAYGGVVAGMQTDLKRALAYSTISHCGFLFTLTVLGGSSIALLYLFLHGFYKALSFICAGDFIRLGAGYQDLNRMGGFFFLSPSLSAQFLISMGNLCGLPFFLGYFFKNNFQSAQLVNNNANFFVNTLLICGLISSLFYFFKVFYCVVFSFKKTNYKNLIDFYKKSLLSFKFPLKSPKALLIIFWFILFVSLCCVFWYFNYTSSTLACNVTDTQVSVVDLNFLQRASIKVSEFTKINYFFLFYTVFCNAILVLHLYNSCRRTG
jgi:NADH:ubiquinone oxidoreductase subunit 5 (subunit L)/multisubunit Na+/H+ antiporter MnhA subunit